MIPVANPIPEPANFTRDCYEPGQRFLQRKPRPKKFLSYWTKFNGDLATAFEKRCGWWAMYIAEGTVEHYLSKDNYPNLAYAWSNYRYASGSINSSKGNLDGKILDPFEVQEGWFEILLPSMQLIRTDAVPVGLREKANFTIEKLHLVNGEKVRQNRLTWYNQFKAGKITLSGLQDLAPLIAAAVRKWQASYPGQPLP
jgi:hypothetical protein